MIILYFCLFGVEQVIIVFWKRDFPYATRLQFLFEEGLTLKSPSACHRPLRFQRVDIERFVFIFCGYPINRCSHMCVCSLAVCVCVYMCGVNRDVVPSRIIVNWYIFVIPARYQNDIFPHFLRAFYIAIDFTIRWLSKTVLSNSILVTFPK